MSRKLGPQGQGCMYIIQIKYLVMNKCCFIAVGFWNIKPWQQPSSVSVSCKIVYVVVLVKLWSSSSNFELCRLFSMYTVFEFIVQHSHSIYHSYSPTSICFKTRWQMKMLVHLSGTIYNDPLSSVNLHPLWYFGTILMSKRTS